MLHMKLLDFDPTGSGGAAPSLPLTFTLADDTKLTVWITNLRTQVDGGVLTATGTATLPGQDSDTFPAHVRGDDRANDRVELRLAFGRMKREPIEFPIDVSRLMVGSGVLGAAAVAGLLKQVLTSHDR